MKKKRYKINKTLIEQSFVIYKKSNLKNKTLKATSHITVKVVFSMKDTKSCEHYRFRRNDRIGEKFNI